MQNFLLTAEIILPLFLVMAAGYLCRWLKLFDEKNHRVMNNLVFRVFLPVLLMNNIRNASVSVLSSWPIFVYATVGVVAVFGLAWLIIPLVEKDDRKRGVMIQAIGRGNYALFGIPLITSMFPGEDVSLASVLLLIVIPLFNGLSVVVLEVYSGRSVNVKGILKGIVTNPLILSSVLGFVLLFTGVKLPGFLDEAINDIAGVASPFALFLLGGAITFSKIKGNLKQLIICVAGKLVLSPLLFLGIGVLLGFRGVELACLLIVFGAPTATSSFTMAQQMGGDGELAAEQVVFSTALSIATVFVFIFAGMQLGLF